MLYDNQHDDDNHAMNPYESVRKINCAMQLREVEDEDKSYNRYC